jgi:UDP-glucuronate decarboxylase
VPIKIARIFNTYGPRMLENDGRVVSNFVVQALRDEPLTIYGRGNQTRSFCYIDDLVDGLELLMASEDRFIGPCNLGNPDEVTINAIADLIIKLTGSKSRIAYRPLPQDDPKRRRPSIAKAAAQLRWKPRVSLETGLKATIGYFTLKVFSKNNVSLVPVTAGPAPGRIEPAAAARRRDVIALSPSRT